MTLQRISNLLDKQKIKDKSSVQFYSKILVQEWPTCLDVLLKKIKFSNTVNNAHERALTILYDNHNSSYDQERTNYFHQQNIDVLMKKHDQFEKDLSPLTDGSSSQNKL